MNQRRMKMEDLRVLLLIMIRSCGMHRRRRINRHRKHRIIPAEEDERNGRVLTDAFRESGQKFHYQGFKQTLELSA